MYRKIEHKVPIYTLSHSILQFPSVIVSRTCLLQPMSQYWYITINSSLHITLGLTLCYILRILTHLHWQAPSHYYGIIANSFSALNIPCGPLSYPTPPPWNDGQPHRYCLHIFGLFGNIVQLESQKAVFSDWLPSLCNMYIRSQYVSL